MTDHKDIHEAINAVMQEVGYVQKQRGDGLKYTYAGEASLIEALRPSMVTHGIYMSVQQVKKVYRSTYETKSGSNMFNTLIEGVVRFMHVTGTFVDVEATGEGSDTGDKSSNKAMTGMYKYALRQTFCIETGDDPDGFSSDDMERSSRSKTAQANPQKSTIRPASESGIVVPDHQKPANASENENTGNGATETAQALSEGFTPNQILGSKNGELVKALVERTQHSTVDVCKFVGALEKGKKYTITQVADQIMATDGIKA